MAIFNSKEFEWSNVRIFMLGRFVTGVRGISYTMKQEKEYIYGSGSDPRAIQTGNKSYEGEIKLLQSELEAMIKRSPDKNILSLRFDIVVSYAADGSLDLVTDILKLCEFTEVPKTLNQNDKFMEVSLPIMFLGIKNQN